MDELKKWMDVKYAENNTRETIEYNGEIYIGYMYGNDECFDQNDFYQYFLTNKGLLKMYFVIPDGCEDYGDIDYSNPCNVRDDDAQYWIDHIICKE